MGSFSDDEGECRYFDAPETIAQGSDLCSSCLESTSDSYEYDLWVRRPRSVRERRRKFLDEWMDLSLDRVPSEDPDDLYGGANALSEEIDRIMVSTGSVLRNSISKDEFSFSQSSASGSSQESGSLANFIFGSGNTDCEVDCKERSLAEHFMSSNHPNVGLDFEDRSCESPSAQQRRQRESPVNGKAQTILKRVKSHCLNRLRLIRDLMNSEGKTENLKSDASSPIHGTGVQRVKVNHCRKNSKELSALFMGQDIPAHDGSILTMKFSLDGQYLASAGEDKILRVWQVVADERSSDFDIPEFDPSCLYFSVNHLSQLTPMASEKERIHKLTGIRKAADSACVILPPKVFRIQENPLHVFHGHCAEISHLSWSKNNLLLSSSIDKTVRLWQVGLDQCLRVFSHSNYVTCVEFNPVNDGYFISGSIDGKIRIWATDGGQVVHWAEIRDIVTAVSYHPSGQGGIIGSITGTCHFFNVTENRIQLEPQLCMISKKKSLDKRITGIQFVPSDPSKVMVTCADSDVRIINGINVIGKYKGPRNCGHQISASFTSDGKHIISAAEDFNVYLWDYASPKESSPSKTKVVRGLEFFSGDASVAVPWSGLKFREPDSGCESNGGDETLNSGLPFSFTSLGHEFFLEAIPKCSATWPEEKLPVSSAHNSPPMSKSEYKFLKSSYQISSSSHAWSLVIVTAGWDGRIRSFHNYGLPVRL
ncbi:PREDICTED: WD repeat-containing protein 44-like [Ipomoea nil]|uniref:WD repeat-containing protein 44-like n=1 Tax=Ipomoea nil TaxID=35883 RepID=UPI00090129B2|nr:PREDICTED: WD repeat-containing protein 44-like [Ipomoea nil]